MPSVPLLNQVNKIPPETVDLPFFFRYKDIFSFKNQRSLAQDEICPTGFGATFVALYVLIYRLFPLCVVANRLRCQ